MACIKCKVKEGVLNVRFATYCEDCFVEQAFHKYRMAVSKAKDEEYPKTKCNKILLAYSGGSNSHLMLYLSQLAYIRNPQRKMHDSYTVVHITESDDTSAVEEYVKTLNLPLVVVKLSDIFKEKEDPKKSLEDLMAACKSDSDRKSIRKILIINLLLINADLLGCDQIYFGENSTKLATNSLSDVCLGKGVNIPWSQSALQRFPSSSFPFISIIRPIRELLKLEVEFFTTLLPCTHSFKGVEPVNENSSIYELTENFIALLDKENPATVSTVNKTASKVNTILSNVDEWSCCSLCIGPLDPSPDSITSHFCYSCQEITENMDVESLNEVLPPTVIHRLVVKLNRK